MIVFLIIHKLFSIDALNVVFSFLAVNPYSFNCTSNNQLFISIFQQEYSIFFLFSIDIASRSIIT